MLSSWLLGNHRRRRVLDVLGCENDGQQAKRFEIALATLAFDISSSSRRLIHHEIVIGDQVERGCRQCLTRADTPSRL